MSASQQLPQQGLRDVPDRVSFPDEERKVCDFWDSIDAFKTSLEMNKDKPLFTFYDGPPFATGTPHYGHLLAGTIKDVVTRYAHQTGHNVERKWGWDCHGLPIEYEIDKKLGITGRADVLKMGIANYNAECRAIVTRYVGEWKRVVRRMGRWIDMENDYKTLNPEFMESEWWVFKQLFDKGLVYRGFKVMPYSTTLSTTLSNFEAGQNYKQVDDPAITVSFPCNEMPGVEFLAWTTTPWTLPSNLALCVNPKMIYVKVRDTKSGKQYLLMKARLDAVFPKVKPEIVEEFEGETLVGKTYEPLFPYFSHFGAAGAFRVVSDSYVQDDAGTGIVHQAPAFGEDDNRVCLKHGIIQKDGNPLCPIDADGRFTAEVPDFSGVYVKTADKGLIAAIKAKGRLFNNATLAHQYPFCWRSDTPLIYKAVPSWFVRVESIRDKIMENNAKTHWVPDFVKEKRFHNWLADARDWAVSRSRFWGTPLPLWVSEDFEEIVCVGSVQELFELSGVKVTDLHREFIDPITIPSKMGKGTLRRVDDVFDCWFESGSMPYAQQHYPFENQDKFTNGFPADFIAEGLDQTRGWFYTLMVLSTALFDKPAFKNLICNGIILAEDGKKMSKRLKNYPDPEDVMSRHGADAMRLYLISSPAVRAENLRFTETGVSDMVKDIFLPFFNAYRFFIQTVKALKVPFVSTVSNGYVHSQNLLDQWIQASMAGLLTFVRKEMAAYRLYTVVPRLLSFMDDLTNWHLRMSRNRCKGKDGQDAQIVVLSVVFEVLTVLCAALAPFVPFISDHIYQNLRLVDTSRFPHASVHFLPYPQPVAAAMNEAMELRMQRMQALINEGRKVRDKTKINLRTPMSKVVVVHSDAQFRSDISALSFLVKDELNLIDVEVIEDAGDVIKLKPVCDAAVLGKRLGKTFAAVQTAVKAMSQKDLNSFSQSGKAVVNGETLTLGEDVKIVYEVASAMADVEATSFLGSVALFHTKLSQDMIDAGTARELVNRVQRLRKKAGLVPSDRIEVFMDAPADIQLVARTHSDLIVKTIGRPILPASAPPSYMLLFGSTEDEVAGKPIKLYLGRMQLHCIAVPEGAKASKSALQNVLNLFGTERHFSNFNEVTFMQFTIDGEKVILTRDKHVTLGLPHA